MKFPAQFFLLMWKNLTIHRRKLVATTAECFLPTIFALVLLLLKLVSTNESHEKSIYETEEVGAPLFPKVLGYVPASPAVEAVAELAIRNHLQYLSSFKGMSKPSSQKGATDAMALPTTKGFENMSAAEAYFERHSLDMTMVLEFREVDSSAKVLPKDLTVIFHPFRKENQVWYIKVTHDTVFNREPRDNRASKGMVYVETIVCRSVLSTWLTDEGKSGRGVADFPLQQKRFPVPAYVVDGMFNTLRLQLTLSMCLSFMMSVFIHTKNVMYEKEFRIKESMRLMGMSLTAFWASWFMTCFLFLLPAVLVFLLVLKVDFKGDGAMFAYSDASVIFVMLLFYSLCVVSYALTITCIVNKGNEGAIIGGIIFLMEYVPYELLYHKSDEVDRFTKLTCCILFNVAMGLSNHNIVRRESRMEGAQWSNIDEYIIVGRDNFTILDSLKMLVVDILVHFTLIWYLDNVFPGEFGVPKPYLFFLTRSYWCGSPEQTDLEERSSLTTQRTTVFFEKEPTKLNIGVQIKGLRKVFGNKVSVSNLNLNMYEGQITVLLGHNGAGKTTTMSMLTGFIPPTKGTALVNGYDINNNIDGVRRSLGLCPQHDILFDVLTVTEHLWFFCKLKGHETKNLRGEIREMVAEIGLESKAKTRVCKISGGQKRSLSVGISLMGGSKVVFLDEPSSGMDPTTRRMTWDLLQKHCKGRTMLLSTHYMDEADTLGSRIAIMADGKLQCCGTPMFLKKLYGAGYHLVIEKEPKCDLKRLTAVIQEQISGAQIETAHTFEACFLLPDTECPKFPDLFRYLSNNRVDLGISSFGVSATTMEEVFLRSELITDERELSQVSSEQRSSATIRQEEIMNIAHFDGLNQGYRPLTGYALAWSQFRALVRKRYLVTLRHWPVTLLLYTLPSIIIFFYFLIEGVTRPQYDTSMEETLLDLHKYVETAPVSVYVAAPPTPAVPTLPATTAPATGANGSGAAASAVAQRSGGSLDLGRVVAAYTGIVHSYGLTTENITPAQVRTLDTFLLDEQERMGRVRFDHKYPLGALFHANGSVVALYNGQPYHTLFVSISLIFNAVAKSFLGSSYELRLGLKPLPREGELELTYKVYESYRSGFQVGMFVGMGFAMYAASVVHFLLFERQSGVKHMHAISGVSMFMYWGPTFAWDACSFVGPTAFLFVLFKWVGNRSFLEEGNWLFCVLAIALFVWAILPTLYVVQFMFESPASGNAGVLVINLFTVLLANLIVFQLNVPGSDTKELGWWMKVAAIVLIPAFNLSESYKCIMQNYLIKRLCEDRQAACQEGFNSLCCIRQRDLCYSEIAADEKCYEWSDSPVTMDMERGIGYCLLAMAVQGVVAWLLLFAVEYGMSEKLYLAMVKGSSKVDAITPDRRSVCEDEDDVASERSRVDSQAAQISHGGRTDPLLMVNLKKFYGSVHAVEGLSFGVGESQCFGLLGQSGAGKTTVFRMLTGETAVTRGNAFFHGCDVRTNLRSVQQQIGYCPQSDAHIGELTAVETLHLYGRLRGIPPKELGEIVKTLIKITLLGAHANRRCGNYSGGNRRKLSLAMALVGNPSFVLLDEPSCGMDPKARRQMWDVLCNIRANGRTLLVSSHSMEECDALCTKLGILLRGRLMCMGSPQHLKRKYGQGYTLVIKMGALPDGTIAPIESVVDFVLDVFPDTVVFDDHQGYVHLQIKDSRADLAQVFSEMERCRQTMAVEDYSVNETTLEQVFLMFTMIQSLGEEERAESCWFLRAGFFSDNLCF